MTERYHAGMAGTSNLRVAWCTGGGGGGNCGGLMVETSQAGLMDTNRSPLPVGKVHQQAAGGRSISQSHCTTLYAEWIVFKFAGKINSQT